MHEVFALALPAQELPAILLSHGWNRLAPLQVTQVPAAVTVPYDLPIGQGVIQVAVSGEAVEGSVLHGARAVGRVVAETCLSLDIDTQALHAGLCGSPEWRWIAAGHYGRFLRSPSLFEDCAKILLAMNTTFRRTEQMSAALVAHYGAAVGTQRAFPTPRRLLEVDDATLRRDTGCGFRAKYLHHLACAAAEYPALFSADGWHSLPAAEFIAALAAITGMGPVSVGYIARLYGKPAGYAVDCWVQRRCHELWGVQPAEICTFVEQRYAQFAAFGPTVFWFELTRHWRTG